MNLFILSLSVTECAQFMFDKHVSKIILEAAQMLSTAVNIIEPEHNLTTYKTCHINHPVSIWVRTSLENFLWTIDLVEAMHNEWKYRNDHPHSKLHKSYEMAMYLKKKVLPHSHKPCLTNLNTMTPLLHIDNITKRMKKKEELVLGKKEIDLIGIDK